jgi:hypothetical protein
MIATSILAGAVALMSSGGSAVEDLPSPSPVVDPASEGAPARSADDRRFSYRFAAGATYRTLYDLSFRGGDGALSLGWQSPHSAFYIEIGSFVGRTAAGLRTVDVQTGLSAEARLGSRFRLGAGGALTYLAIVRAASGDAMTSLTIGPRVHASIDVSDLGEGKLYLAARAGLELWPAYQHEPRPIMALATLLLGLRH